MLHELTIEGLRGVGRAELKFVPRRMVHTLFGSNGVGKTKCLEAIYQFLLLSNKTFLKTQISQGIHSKFAVMRSATDGHEHHFQLPPISDHGHMQIAQVWQGEDATGFHDLPVLLLGAVQRSSMQEQTVSGMIGTFAQRREGYFRGLVQALQDQKLSSLGMMGDVRSWFVARAQSVNPYQKDADNRKVEIDAVLQVLNGMDERIDAAELQVDGAGRVSLKVDGQMRELSELSSGFTSLVKLVQAIISGYASFTNETNLRQVKGIVLIDEIESHLHARWQSQIVPRLKALLPNTTFYIATHSPLVLAQLEEGEAYLLERGNDGVVRSSIIDSPDRRAFADVLESAFGVDLNSLKRRSLERSDQTAAKQALLRLIEQGKGAGE